MNRNEYDIILRTDFESVKTNSQPKLDLKIHKLYFFDVYFFSLFVLKDRTEFLLRLITQPFRKLEKSSQLATAL